MKRLLAFLLLPLFAAAQPTHAPHPGGIAIVPLGVSEQAPDARFDGKPVLVTRAGDEWLAIVGIPLDQATGTANLVVGDQRLSFTVVPHSYREQHLTVAPKFVNPDPSAQERIADEQREITAAMTYYRRSPVTLRALQPPIPGARSDSFGSRRFFNKEPRSPHRGMDIKGNTGTEIKAPLAGTVLLTGDFYFTGNAVFLDHGQGLVTLYAHLDNIGVEIGDRLNTGAVLGTVGATGRVTGAHLHFATYLNGTAVDPALLLEPAP